MSRRIGLRTIPSLEAVELPLEGNYSTWTKKWEYTFSEGLNNIVGASFHEDFLYVIYLDGSVKRRYVIINLSDGSNKFLSTAGEHYFKSAYGDDYDHARYNALAYMDGSLVFSIKGKYVVVGRLDTGVNQTTTFEVWKDGVKAWTSLASDAVSGASYYIEAGVRYDGKIIIALTDNNMLVCFEGS